jgi:hypothetical protein
VPNCPPAPPAPDEARPELHPDPPRARQIDDESIR